LETLEARLRGREIGSGLDWHLNRAGELAKSLMVSGTPSDHRISTDNKTVANVAEEIVSKIKWRRQNRMTE